MGQSETNTFFILEELNLEQWFLKTDPHSNYLNGRLSGHALGDDGHQKLTWRAYGPFSSWRAT